MRKFGEELIKLRKNRHLTLEEVSKETSYSVKRLRELEKNNGLPSIDLLTKLSSCYKANLNIYFSAIEYEFPSRTLRVFLKFIDAFEKYQFDEINKLIDEYEDNEYFQTGEGLKIIYLSKAFCLAGKGDYENSVDKLLEVLDIFEINLDNIEEENLHYTFLTFNILVSLGGIFFLNKEIESAKELIISLDNILKTTYFHDENLYLYNHQFMIRLLLINSNNLSQIYKYEENLDKALECIDFAIDFCTEYYKIYLLNELYISKLEILYLMENYEESGILANVILSFFKIEHNKKSYESFKNKTEKEFSKLHILDYNK